MAADVLARSRRGVSVMRWAMNSAGTPVLSVRAEARQLVASDYAVLDGLIEHTAGSSAVGHRQPGSADC